MYSLFQLIVVTDGHKNSACFLSKNIHELATLADIQTSIYQ